MGPCTEDAAGLGVPAPWRRRLVALGMLGAMSGVLAASASPASAEMRTITLTLLGGKPITITVDVPPGTLLDQITLPPVNTPILSVTESPAATPAPAPQAPAAPAPATHASTKKERARHHATAKKKQVTAPATAVVRKAKAKPHVPAVKPPTAQDPTFSYALPGPAPVGVPDFFIDKFRIPPFLLSIYQAAGIQYGVRWEILAAINEIETDYGRNLNTSTAGAIGWMQFLPSTWKRYGVDANADGKKDPYNPVDAIFSAARYLKAAGAQQDVRKAIFAYNHADWYVDSVLMRARLIGGLPADLVGSLTGLTQGRFPVAAAAKYAESHQKLTNVFARSGAAVVAVQDGKIVRLGHTARLGRFVQLRDVYGNTYTYAGLKRLPRTVPVPIASERLRRPVDLPKAGPRPSEAATAGAQRLTRHAAARKERVFAHPPDAAAGTVFKGERGFTRHVKLRKGLRVIAGTVLGRIGTLSKASPSHLVFRIRPAGKGAPLIDPKPILDGYKLLESTANYRAQGRNALLGGDASIGQILLMSKEQLQRRLLADPRVHLLGQGIADVREGLIDRRVLATLEFLSASGLEPTVSMLRTGHSLLTSSGNVSEHASGNAVDIAKINGIPILGHQGPGSITEITIRRLLTLQGTMKPHQIISLMTFDGADNTLALPDHADHIHVGFQPLYGDNAKTGRELSMILKPGQWTRLVDRLGHIPNPTIPVSVAQEDQQ